MDFLKTRSFPSFYQEHAPKLIEFFGAWIEWMNESGNMAYVIDHLSSESDIDESVEKYKSSIKDKILSEYPEEISSDLKLLLKNIFYLYNSKASIKSYDFLFRCLYDSPATILYPKEYILRASDGRWEIPRYMSTCMYMGNPSSEDVPDSLSNYINYSVRGAKSNASGFISSSTIYSFHKENSSPETRYCITLDSVYGTFEEGELLILRNVETDEETEGEFVVYRFEEGKGDWTSTKGFLDSNMILQDGYYYQDFSYIIRSKVSISKWQKLIRTIIHPAGLEVFGELLLGEDDDGVTKKETSPMEFLKTWHILFKMYVFDVSVRSNYMKWIRKYNILAQRHSETMDAWLYYGRYHQNDVPKIIVDEANTLFNRNAVLMFRDDGTLINPNIIQWATFNFTEDVKSKVGENTIDTKTITGVTLTPKSHIVCDRIVGSELGPVEEESFIDKNFMFFTTQKNPHQSNLVRQLILKNEYVKSGTEDSYLLVGNTKPELDSAIQYYFDETTDKYISIDNTAWKTLTLNDFIRTNGADRQIYDKNSFLKVPEECVTVDSKEFTYNVTDRSLNEEQGVVVSYTPIDFKSRIFVNRENSNVDIHYMNYNWFFGERNKNNLIFSKDAIIDTNLKLNRTTTVDGTDYHKDVYHCVSYGEDISGNAVQIQQTQFTLRLPCDVRKEDVLMFANGKRTDNFKLKSGNVIVVDTTDYDYGTQYYIQSDGRVTKDKDGLLVEDGYNFVYLLERKNAWIKEDKNSEHRIHYFAQESYVYNVINNVNEVCYELRKSFVPNSDVVYILTPLSNKYIPLFVRKDGNVIDADGNVRYFCEDSGMITPFKGASFYSYKILWTDRTQVTYTMTESYKGGDEVYTSIPYFDVMDVSTGLPVWRLSTSYIHTTINNKVISCRPVVSIDNNMTILYLTDDNVFLSPTGIEMYYLDKDNNVRDDSISSEPLFKIQDYRIIANKEGVVKYYWHKTKEGGVITTSSTYIPSVTNVEYNVIYYGYLLGQDRETIKYYIYNNEISKTIFGDDVLYYIQPNNTITKSNFKYEATQVEFDECVLSDILSTSQTNTNRLSEMDVSSEVVIDLENVRTKELGDFTLNEMLYYIYNATQTVINSTAEVYILSNKEHNRIETNPYEGNSYGRNFIYNSAILSPFAMSNAKIRHTHMVDLKDYTDFGIESTNWNLLWTKMLHSPTESINRYIRYLNSITQNHSETMDEIFTEEFDKLYNFGAMDRDTIFSMKNESSTLLFLEDGLLVHPKDIDWGNKTLKVNTNSEYIHSVPLNPDIPYKEIQVINGTPSTQVNVSTDSLFFIDGKKIPNELITKTQSGIKISDVTGTVLVFDHSENMYSRKYYFAGRNEVVSIPISQNNTHTNEYLHNFYGDSYIVKHTNDTELLARLSFSDYVITYEASEKKTARLSSLTGESILETMSSNVPIQEKYLLVFVDGKFTTNYEYRTDGTLFISNPSKESMEVYVLVPHSMNDLDICRVDKNNRFTFHNLRVNTIAYNSSVNSLTKTNMLLSHTDIMFLRRLLERTNILEQQMLYESKYSLTTGNPSPNVMLHYTMDRMLLDGNFFMEDYESIIPENSAVESLIGDVPVWYTESKLNKYATMMFDDRGLIVNPNSIEWGYTEFRIPQATKSLTFVCLNPNKPAIVGELDNNYKTFIPKEDEFFDKTVMFFLNGKKVFVKEGDNKVSHFLIKNNGYELTIDFEEYRNPRPEFAILGNLIEENYVLEYSNAQYTDLKKIHEENDVYVLENNYVVDKDVSVLTEKSIVVYNNENAKECVVFQYNPYDLDAIIQEYKPQSRMFYLPNRTYESKNILVFVNGYRTTNYEIAGDILVLPEQPVTLEVYVFKPYDYLYVDENKYDSKSLDFITKNIKRSIFF